VGYLRDSQCTVEQVAERAGYQHPRILTQHTLAVFGARPSQLRTLSDDDTLAALLTWTRLKLPPRNVPVSILLDN
jgi:AraC-like DNA-binding protein